MVQDYNTTSGTSITTSSYSYNAGVTLLDNYYSVSEKKELKNEKYSLLPIVALNDLIKVINKNKGKELNICVNEEKLVVDGNKRSFIHLVVKYNSYYVSTTPSLTWEQPYKTIPCKKDNWWETPIVTCDSKKTMEGTKGNLSFSSCD